MKKSDYVIKQALNKNQGKIYAEHENHCDLFYMCVYAAGQWWPGISHGKGFWATTGHKKTPQLRGLYFRCKKSR
jgi:hypothetical protein